jgi:hypothetical protein
MSHFSTTTIAGAAGALTRMPVLKNDDRGVAGLVAVDDPFEVALVGLGCSLTSQTTRCMPHVMNCERIMGGCNSRTITQQQK